MPVAVYRAPGEVEVDDREVPTAGPGEVLVEVGWCGICGSDIHLMLEGWGKPGTVEGHEWSGVVAAVGDGVTDWNVRDRVAAGRARRALAAPGRPGRAAGGGPARDHPVEGGARRLGDGLRGRAHRRPERGRPRRPGHRAGHRRRAPGGSPTTGPRSR